MVDHHAEARYIDRTDTFTYLFEIERCMAKNQGQLQRRKNFYLDYLNVYILYVFTQNAMHHKNNDKRQVRCDIPPSVYTHLPDVSL